MNYYSSIILLIVCLNFYLPKTFIFQVANYILDYRIWLKNFEYRNNQLDLDLYVPDYQVIQKIYEYENFYDYDPDSDYCLQDIIHLTTDLISKKCYISSDCWEKYYGYDIYSTGYTLTHK